MERSLLHKRGVDLHQAVCSALALSERGLQRGQHSHRGPQTPSRELVIAGSPSPAARRLVSGRSADLFACWGSIFLVRS